MKGRVVTIFSFLFLCVGETVSFGQSMSSEDALRLAYRDNPQMKEAHEEIQASIGRRISQGTLEGPEVSFEIGGFKSEEVGGEKVSPDKNLDSFELTQSLDLPPVWILKNSIAQDDVRIAQGNFNLAWAAVRSRVKSNFSQVFYSMEALKVQNSNLEASRQFLDRVELKYQSGNATRAERLRANIEVLQAQSEYLEAENRLALDKAGLNLLLGRASDFEFDVEGVLSYEAVEIKRDELLKKALGDRADLLNQRIQAGKLSKERQKSVWEVFPKPFIGFNRVDEDFEDDYSVIFGAKFPAWDLNFGAIKEKAAEEQKARIRLEALEREIVNEVSAIVRELENLKRKVEIHKKALDEANELLREVTLQYEEGDIHFTVFLENLKAIKETRLSYFQVLKQYAEGVAELERITQSARIPEGAKS